jgi:hypothetical protein
MNFPRFANASTTRSATVAVGLATVLALSALSSPTPSSAAQATTKKKSSATTTVKKKSATTTTVKKKTDTASGSATAKATTTTIETSPASASTTTTKPTSGTGGPTTTAKPLVKSTVFIPGAGRVIDLGSAEVAKLAAGGKVEADVRGAVGLAASGIGTVLLDVTAANPAQPGTITVNPVAPDYARAVVGATVGFVAGATTVSRVAVPVGANGQIRVTTTAGPAGLAISVVGWVITSPGASAEPSAVVLEPCRVLDTVTGLGGLKDLVTPARPFDIPTTGIAKVPAAIGAAQTPTGVILAVGATQVSGPLDLTVVPTGGQTPSLSMNLVAGQIGSGLYLVPVGADARTAFYVSANGTQLTVDVVGWLDRDGVARSGGPC